MRQAKNLVSRFALSDAWKRVLLYGSASASIFALGVALLMPKNIGPEGFILAFGIAAVLVVLLYALWSGDATAKAMSPASVAKLDKDPAFALAALDQSKDAVIISSARGDVIFANASYRKLLKRSGVMAQSGRPSSFEQLVGGHPGLSAIAFRMAKAARAQENLSERLPSFEIDGEMMEFDAEVSALPGGQSILRLQKRASLHDGGGALSSPIAGTAMIDTAPVGFFSAGHDGKTRYMNETLRTWLGIATNAPSPDITDFVSGNAARVLGRRGTAGEVTRSEVMLQARDGIETAAVIVTNWAEDERQPSSRSVVFGSGRAASPAGVAQALEPANLGDGHSLDEIFNAAPFGVARLDGQELDLAVIEDCNPALMQMSGGVATPGTAFLKLFHADNDQIEDSLNKASLSDQTPTEVMLVGQSPRACHLYLASDRAGRTLVYLMDMAGWKELESQLFQAQKMHAIGKLAGGIAHDFNTLLGVIRLNCDELLACHPIGDPSYGELQQINLTVNRSKALVKQLLAFSHKQTIQAKQLDVAEFLSDVTILLKQVLQESVKLEVKHAREKLTVRADRRHLETALMNLATNARDAMKDRKGASLVIQTSFRDAIPAEAAADKNPPAGNWVLIEVIDNGTGMDEEVLAKVFEPFYTTKGVGQGTGLGLSTVYGIIKQSGGYLHPVSKLGEGTNFQLWLPASEAKVIPAKTASKSAPAKEKPKPPSDLSGRGKILFVEDEAALRSIAAKTLVKRGYEVLQAGDGEEALELAREHAGTIDLLISDVVMPTMDGPTMLKEAREYLADSRIVFISGYAEEEFSEILSQETDVSFLPKPFSLKELATKVKEELAQKTGQKKS
ncbi:sensory box histidine kinase/response regulator [hydrothermal vent metagenome]|uniref:Sensory box histidine kinase/response regulator n=1 Tax=hydrothermal vent metagenome TaxID=652676 RepID=A0A3B0RFL8_9ZZZZ